MMEILTTSDPIDVMLVYIIVGIGSLGVVSLASDIFDMVADFYNKINGEGK